MLIKPPYKEYKYEENVANNYRPLRIALTQVSKTFCMAIELHLSIRDDLSNYNPNSNGNGSEEKCEMASAMERVEIDQLKRKYAAPEKDYCGNEDFKKLGGDTHRMLNHYTFVFRKKMESKYPRAFINLASFRGIENGTQQQLHIKRITMGIRIQKHMNEFLSDLGGSLIKLEELFENGYSQDLQALHQVYKDLFSSRTKKLFNLTADNLEMAHTVLHQAIEFKIEQREAKGR